MPFALTALVVVVAALVMVQVVYFVVRRWL